MDRAPMKALSLWQPWATLVAIGAKEIETRGRWQYAYRGELAIHAARHWSPQLDNLCWQEPFLSVLQPLLDAAPVSKRSFGLVLPFGRIVARTRLNNVFRTEPVAEVLKRTPNTSPHELAFGDFSPGRRALELGPTVALAETIPFSGHQGLFNLDEERSARVRELAPWPWEQLRAEVSS